MVKLYFIILTRMYTLMDIFTYWYYVLIKSNSQTIFFVNEKEEEKTRVKLVKSYCHMKRKDFFEKFQFNRLCGR